MLMRCANLSCQLEAFIHSARQSECICVTFRDSVLTVIIGEAPLAVGGSSTGYQVSVSGKLTHLPPV